MVVNMKKALYITLSYAFIQSVIHNLGHVVTPVFVAQNEIPRYMFGFFFSAMSLGLLIGGPIWGILGDQKNKRMLIVLGLAGYSLGQFLFVSTTNLYLMTFFRFISGFSVSAPVTLILSQVINLSPNNLRTKYLTIYAALFALGTTIGYKIGGFMGDYFIKEVFYIQVITNLVYAGFVLMSFKELKRSSVHKKETFVQGFKDITKMDLSLLIFLIALTLATTSATIIQRYLDVYVTLDLGRSTNELGDLVLITGIVGFITNFFIVPFLTRLQKDFALMKWIQVLSAITIFIVFRSQYIIVALYTGYMFYIVLKSVYQPLEQNYISLNAQGEKYGSIMGVRQAFFAMGMVIGPLVAGFIYDYNPILVFDISSIMFIIAFILLFISQSALKKKQFVEPLTASHQYESIEYKASP
jgi:predicted MFS family arabinose efflux permease